MKEKPKPNLLCFNGAGTDPPEINLTLSPADRAAFNALSKERYAEGESVIVTDLPTGNKWRVKRTSCNAGCFCAAEAIPASSLTVVLSDRDLATVLFALRNLQQDITGDSEFRDSLKDEEHFVNGIEMLSLQEIDALCARINHG